MKQHKYPARNTLTQNFAQLAQRTIVLFRNQLRRQGPANDSISAALPSRTFKKRLSPVKIREWCGFVTVYTCHDASISALPGLRRVDKLGTKRENVCFDQTVSHRLHFDTCCVRFDQPVGTWQQLKSYNRISTRNMPKECTFRHAEPNIVLFTSIRCNETVFRFTSFAALPTDISENFSF